MAKKMSTAFSDLVLAASAVWSYSKLSENPEVDLQFSKWWFMLQTIAASLGVVNFGRFLPNYENGVKKYHKNFSWLAMAVGMPCLGAQFSFLHGLVIVSQGFLGSAVVSFVVCSRRPKLREKMPLAVSGTVLLILLIIGFKDKNMNLCYAVSLFVVSAVAGDKGTIKWINVPRVDFMHYALTLTNIFTVRALLFY